MKYKDWFYIGDKGKWLSLKFHCYICYIYLAFYISVKFYSQNTTRNMILSSTFFQKDKLFIFFLLQFISFSCKMHNISLRKGWREGKECSFQEGNVSILKLFFYHDGWFRIFPWFWFFLNVFFYTYVNILARKSVVDFVWTRWAFSVIILLIMTFNYILIT